MQSFQVQSSFEIAPMSVHLSSADLYLQDLEDVLISQPDWDGVSSSVQDDGMQDVFNSHAISQPDIAYQSSCNLDEETFANPRLQPPLKKQKYDPSDNRQMSLLAGGSIGNVGNALPRDEGSHAISSTTFSSYPRTASTHGNRTQVENTLPQDLQDKVKEELQDIIDFHKNMQFNGLHNYKEVLAKHFLIRRSFSKINKSISSRALRIIQYLTTPIAPNYKDKLSSNKRNFHRSRGSIKRIMENLTALGLTQFNKPLSEMDACYARMIMCIEKVQLNHKGKISTDCLDCLAR